MLVAGIGCRRGTSAEDIEAAICLARKEFACDEPISAIATEGSKAAEPGLREVARRLGVALEAYSLSQLQSRSGAVLTVSPAALAHKGISSVAEAAALLAAGANARLLGARVTIPTTTCALAIGDGPRGTFGDEP